jgi:hypothetical protein
MALPSYSVRTEAVDEGFVAYIDLDNAPCIKQPNLPGLNGFFATEASAKQWADEHAASLSAMAADAEQARLRKVELEETQLAAAKAQIQSAQDLTAILSKLTNPTA